MIKIRAEIGKVAIMQVKWIVLFVCLLFIALDAKADSLRCNGRVVSTGETKTDVIGKCGEPADMQSRQEAVVDRTDPDLKRVVTITIDEWTYNFGPDSFIRSLVFKNGVLTSIAEGGYGY